MENYICKIANIDEMNIKWDYEIEHASEDRYNWIRWKNNAIKNVKEEKCIVYYGILNGKIICEATANINPDIVQNSNNLVNTSTAYLSAFRTIKEYQAKGYFSKLFKFMLDDLKKRGYEKVTLGVEPSEVKNMLIYFNYGFDTYIKTDTETYPDGTIVDVNYYSKNL